MNRLLRAQSFQRLCCVLSEKISTTQQEAKVPPEKLDKSWKPTQNTTIQSNRNYYVRQDAIPGESNLNSSLLANIACSSLISYGYS
eukprot:4992217-Amphidinium_carterae.2